MFSIALWTVSIGGAVGAKEARLGIGGLELSRPLGWSGDVGGFAGTRVVRP